MLNMRQRTAAVGALSLVVGTVAGWTGSCSARLSGNDVFHSNTGHVHIMCRPGNGRSRQRQPGDGGDWGVRGSGGRRQHSIEWRRGKDHHVRFSSGGFDVDAVDRRRRQGEFRRWSWRRWQHGRAARVALDR